MFFQFDEFNIGFESLRVWAEKDPGNWNILLGIGFGLLIVGVVLNLIYMFKAGKKDERTVSIDLQSAYIMLIVIILSDIIFPKEYMWQIFFLYKYGLAFIASGVYLWIRYRKDFHS